MSDNPFDKAGRKCLHFDPVGILRWLLPGLSPTCTFQRWIDARTIAFPGEPDRTCDTVAELLQAGVPPIWWLLVLELQSERDEEMFGRLLEYLGRLWRTLKTPEQPPDRYHVAAALVHFTGRGRTSRDLRLPGTAARTCLRIVEKNVAADSAELTLANIESGTWTRALLPLIPLMKGGKKASIIQQWKVVAETEADDKWRKEFAGLARVFADLAKRGPIWRQALEGWNMKQSESVLEWQAEAAAKTRADDIIKILRLRFGPDIPAEVEERIRGTSDLGQLDGWLETAVRARTLKKFREHLSS